MFTNSFDLRFFLCAFRIQPVPLVASEDAPRARRAERSQAGVVLQIVRVGYSGAAPVGAGVECPRETQRSAGVHDVEFAPDVTRVGEKDLGVEALVHWDVERQGICKNKGSKISREMVVRCARV